MNGNFIQAFFLYIGCIVTLLFLAGPVLKAPIRKSVPPNILLIAVDDLNDYIGAMGHPNAITPNLDKLIRKGTLFANAQCQSPMCSPSRVAIMTGLRPSTTGIYGFLDDNLIQQTNDATRKVALMPQYFKDGGYHTMAVGKVFHEHAPDGLFDESGGREKGFGPSPSKRFHWDKKGTSTDWGAFPEHDNQMPDYRTAKWAVERLDREYTSPFFLAVGFLRPHVPWYVPQKWFDLYDTASIQLPQYLPNDSDDLPAIALQIDDLPMMPSTEWAIEQGQWKNILHGYLASVSFVDHYIGEVLDALEGSKHAENTIVVLWSDHGYRLGEKGTFAKVALWNRATLTPLVFAGSGIPENTRIHSPVELFAIYPTLAELAGMPQVPGIESKSLVPLIQQPNRPWPHPAITTWARNNHAIVNENYRYIRYEDGSEELYNLARDPQEWHNIAANPENATVIKEMAVHLPKVNALWAAASRYDNNAYFIRQKLEQSE